MEQIHNKGKAQVFENPILDHLTKSNPFYMLAVSGSFIVFSFYLHAQHGLIRSPGWGLLLFLSGIVCWTLVEYLMHRYVFHFVNESAWSQKFHHLAHGIHHTYPRDAERLFMPPLPAILLASLFLSTFYLLMGTYAFLFFPGFILGYVLYVSLHYAMHRHKPPKFLKALWAHHALHHYKYPDKAYGVSTRIWDRIFGTMPPQIQRSRQPD
jgi:4-hydroxysphinganine ceramide fatty acyl 2-hydroxylase